VRTNAAAIAKASGQAIADESEEQRPTSRRQGSSNRQNGQKAANHTSPRPAARIGRNDPCPCGSGKKYKRCHGA
jgi:uncharacterized protein YecA (UPF0149 family)